MIRYNEVSITTWISRDFSTLTPHGKLLWLYLLTGPIRKPLPGIYRAGVGSCTDDLGWSAEAFKKAFNELSDKKMAIADWSFNVIYLPNWTKYNRPPANPNVLKSWLGMLDGIPDCDLKNEYIDSMMKISVDNNTYTELINEWVGERLDKLNTVVVKKKVVKKVERDLDNFVVLAENYAAAVKEVFPKLSIFKNGSIPTKMVQTGAAELEKLHRLDGVAVDSIDEVLRWIISSYDETASFNWLANLQSLKSIRRKSSNGNSKWENIVVQYATIESQGKKKDRKIDYSDVTDGTNSPI